MKMTEGTKSWLFGYHSILHSIYVYIAWVKLYGTMPSLMETFCIFIHDIGYCGKNYLTNRDHSNHEVMGAKIAGFIFGKPAYDLCMGHRIFNERLEKPDEYSHSLMPIIIVYIQWKIENNPILKTPQEWKKYNLERWNKRKTGIILSGQFVDTIRRGNS